MFIRGGHRELKTGKLYEQRAGHCRRSELWDKFRIIRVPFLDFVSGTPTPTAIPTPDPDPHPNPSHPTPTLKVIDTVHMVYKLSSHLGMLTYL